MGLSTHILDIARGRPAANVALCLSQLHRDTWQLVGNGVTDTDGRCRTLLGTGELTTATYQLRFETAAYFAVHNEPALYPFIEICFLVSDPAQHYHIPLLLAPNGYTTYRGS